MGQARDAQKLEGLTRRHFLKISGLGGLGIYLANTPFVAAAQVTVEKQSLLEQNIRLLLAELQKKDKLMPGEKTAWSTYTFNDNEKLVSINEEAPFQSASMIKPLVGLAYLTLVERERKLTYNEEASLNFALSIHRSNNKATNWIMEKVGGPKAVNETLHRYYPGIFKQTSIVEWIPDEGTENGRTYRNKASARDYSCFLYALWHHQLPFSEELLRVMSLKNKDRILTGTRIPHYTERVDKKGVKTKQKTLVIDKTGTTGMLCGNMGMLVPYDKKGNCYPYTIIGIIQRAERCQTYKEFIAWRDSRAAIIRHVSEMVYEYMATRYKLPPLLTSAH